MTSEIVWSGEPGMVLHERDGVVWLSFPAFDGEAWLQDAFSTRLGGVSPGFVGAMNQDVRREKEHPEHVAENFRIFAEAVGLAREEMVFSAQTHTVNVRRVGAEDKGVGTVRPVPWTDVDGLITDVPDVTLVTFYADCVPLFFADPVHRAIGLSHAGWRGTAADMGGATVRAMREAFGTEPADLICAIGPSIGPESYEVDEACASCFPYEVSVRKPDGKYMLDLWEANRLCLLDAGVRAERIYLSGLNTAENADFLFSHRASHGKRGEMCAFLTIRNNSAP